MTEFTCSGVSAEQGPVIFRKSEWSVNHCCKGRISLSRGFTRQRYGRTTNVVGFFRPVFQQICKGLYWITMRERPYPSISRQYNPAGHRPKFIDPDSLRSPSIKLRPWALYKVQFAFWPIQPKMRTNPWLGLGLTTKASFP